ncbi:NHL repeat-containing protein 3 [Protopterus annectens]|uniref:NHL repeat-containing protein 3 n=1 Tax=Protopterus annectens TaxID=7888 RepID=UPI001CF99392|nr:NHL repeat-containing protein 3 [Protopterus annectens]
MKLRSVLFLSVFAVLVVSVMFVFHCYEIDDKVIGGFVLSYFRSLETPLYKLDPGWPRFAEHFTGQSFGVAVDSSSGLVYVAQRGDDVPKVLVFSENGFYLGAWNTTTLEMPHGITLDNNTIPPSLWITDVGNGNYGHTVKKYSSSGELVRVLGTAGRAGSSLNPLQFDQPAEAFVDDAEDIYIVDGDGGMNNRLLKITSDLEVLWTHGEKGTQPAQFNIPHSVTVDSYNRVWVADRKNKRIQAFNSVTGEWLGSWSNCFKDDAPYSVRLTADKKYMIVAQLNISQILILTVPPVGVIGDCHIASTIRLAEEVKPHLVDVSLKTDAIYVAEIGAQQVQKFVSYS